MITARGTGFQSLSVKCAMASGRRTPERKGNRMWHAKEGVTKAGGSSLVPQLEFRAPSAISGLCAQLLLSDAYRPPNLSGIEYDKLDRLIGRKTTMCRLNGFRQSLAGMQNPAFSRASFFYR